MQFPFWHQFKLILNSIFFKNIGIKDQRESRISGIQNWDTCTCKVPSSLTVYQCTVGMEITRYSHLLTKLKDAVKGIKTPSRVFISQSACSQMWTMSRHCSHFLNFSNTTSYSYSFFSLVIF